MSPKSPAVTRTHPRMPERKVTQASLGQADEVSLPLLPTKMPSQTRHPLPLPAPAVPYGTEPGDGTPPRQARGCAKQPSQGATATAHSTTGTGSQGCLPAQLPCSPPDRQPLLGTRCSMCHQFHSEFPADEGEHSRSRRRAADRFAHVTASTSHLPAS